MYKGVLSSVVYKTSVQEVDRMCTNMHKLYTPSMTSLDTLWEIEFISQTVSSLHTGSIPTCAPLGHVRAQGSFQAVLMLCCSYSAVFMLVTLMISLFS